MTKRKKHFAPAATGQEILDAVGVTKEERERVKCTDCWGAGYHVHPHAGAEIKCSTCKGTGVSYKPATPQYEETLKYSKEGKRELAKLAKSRWKNAKKAAIKLEGVRVKGDKVEVVGRVPKKDKKRVKKLLEELEKNNPFTPERIKEIQEETRKRLEIEEEERKKPPKSPVGTCGVCQGDVKAEYVHGLRGGVDYRFVPIGPGGRQYYGWNFKGYSCVECGLMYKFAPKPHKAE